MLSPHPTAASGVRVVWTPELLAYDFGPGHPMTPVRLDLTHRLILDLGLADAPGVSIVGAEPADDETLLLAHDAAYVDAVREASRTGEPDVLRGLGTEDDPVFLGMHEAAARVVTGSVDAARAVWRGEVRHGVNLAGGLHHAMADHASGFCVYNDAVAAIRTLLAEGAERVAYVDLDAHHGDGVEQAFWDDPRVLTASVHESGLSLFPGTGHATDVGGPHARGRAVNVALPARTTDAAWLRAVEAVFSPVLRAWRPQVVVSQHGCDAHRLDMLTHLEVSVDAQRAAMRRVHDLAHELAEGRWLALGGGGYAVALVVPRVWAHLVATAAHVELGVDVEVPASWRAHVTETLGLEAPVLMGDGTPAAEPRPWSAGYDPADDVDRAVLATRRAVFHWYDLDPLYD